MKLGEFQAACDDASKKYHIAYMAWLKKQDITRDTFSTGGISSMHDWGGSPPEKPTIEITIEDECELLKEDVHKILFDWFQPGPITLNGKELYGVTIIVKG